MPGITVTFDPEGVPLPLVPAGDGLSGFWLLSPFKKPLPQRTQQWSSNADTEGELSAGGKDENVEMPVKLRIAGADESTFRALQLQLEQKLHKVGGDEGGVVRVEWPDGEWLDYEIRGVTGGDRLFDNRFVHHWRTEDEITLIVEPFGKGEEYLVGEFSVTDRVGEIIAEGVLGTAEALARAEVVSPNGDVYELSWGRDSRHFDGADTAKALYAAKDLTPLGGAAATTVTVDGKAGVSVVRQGVLTPNWTAMLSLTIDGVGPMTHQGIFEAYAWVHMPATNSGEVAISGEYGAGDLSIPTTLEATYFPANHAREGRVVLLPLGQWWLNAGARGPHQWEGRILAKSTVVGDDLDVLDVALLPVGELNGRVSATPSLKQPAALLVRDEFEQASGNLGGKTIAAAGFVTGPASAGAGASVTGVGTIAWANPGNITAADESTAAATLKSGEVSRYARATSFGFALPSTAVVDGVKFEVRRRGPAIKDERVRLVKANAVQSVERASGGYWPTFGFAYATYGASTDKFGATLAYSDVNNSGFGIAVACTNAASFGSWTAEIEHVRCTVYWTDSAGQQWATSGDAQDVTVDEPSHTAQRTAVSDASLAQGRYAVAGGTVTRDVVAGLKFKRSSISGAGASERVRGGALARYVDENNWLFFGLDAIATASPTEESLRVFKRVAGGEPTELGRLSIPTQYDVTRSFWLHVDRRGRWFAWGSLLEGGVPRLLMAGQDNDLAFGGALDDGKVGLYDVKTGGNSCTRIYDNFVAWVPTLDAVIFEGCTLELSHDRVERESPEGRWIPLVPEVDYLKLAPAGMENRKNRLVLMGLPHDAELMGVGFPSELKVALYATPRYRGVPDPA